MRKRQTKTIKIQSMLNFNMGYCLMTINRWDFLKSFHKRVVKFRAFDLHNRCNLVSGVVALRAKILDLGNVKASFAAALGLRILC